MRNKNLLAVLGFAGTLLFFLIAFSENRKPSIERLRKAYAGMEIDEE